MKKRLLTLRWRRSVTCAAALTCLLACVTLMQAQMPSLPQDATGTYIVGSDYLASYKSPVLFRKGDVLRFETDSFYLINPMRYALYKQLQRQAKGGKMQALTGDVLRAYEASLGEAETLFSQWQENQARFDAVMESYFQASKAAMDAAESNYHRLNGIAADLETEVARLQKQQKRQSGWAKFGKSSLKIMLGVAAGLVVYDRLIKN